MTQPNQSAERSSMFQATQEFLKQSYQLWEQLTSQYMESLIRNQEFLAMTGKALEQSVQFKQQIDRLVEASLANLQLPTRGEMERALHKLNELESLLRDLHAKVDRLVEQS
jgi:chemotaxis regulatin CheY-phosphate phosphatase CheZ